jgi:bacteriocin-like protein
MENNNPAPEKEPVQLEGEAEKELTEKDLDNVAGGGGGHWLGKPPIARVGLPTELLPAVQKILPGGTI